MCQTTASGCSPPSSPQRLQVGIQLATVEPAVFSIQLNEPHDTLFIDPPTELKLSHLIHIGLAREYTFSLQRILTTLPRSPYFQKENYPGILCVEFEIARC